MRLNEVQPGGYHSPHIDLVDTGRFLRAAEFIRSDAGLGLRPLDDTELDGIAARYSGDVALGIERRESSLKMIDTHLPPVDTAILREGSRALVIEIGGSNERYADAAVTDGKVKEQSYQKHPITNRVYDSADAYFKHIVDGVDTIAAKGEPDALAIIWSFPGKAVVREDGTGVDVISAEELTKEFVIPGISKRPVGEVIRELLAERYGWRRDLPVAVMNDTRAAEGGIVGTGFNLAFGQYNSESGGFDKVDRGYATPRIFRDIDQSSGRPGSQLAEKQISGGYLGEVIRLGAERLYTEGLLPQRVSHTTAEMISRIVSGKVDQKLRMDYMDAQTYATLMYLAHNAAVRSAQLVGTMVGAGILTTPEMFPDKEVQYTIEGSVFWGIPGYAATATEAANRLTAGIKNIQFVQKEHAGILGAATAALAQTK